VLLLRIARRANLNPPVRHRDFDLSLEAKVLQQRLWNVHTP
jgi:hypothetical protein